MSATIPIGREHGIELLRQMILVRRFEEKCVELYSATKIRGFMHLYIGEEAVAVGTMAALGPEDAIVPPTASMATPWCEAFRPGRSWPRCTARWRAVRADAAARCTCSTPPPGSMAATPSSGGGLPLAVGFALADKLRGRRRVTACFFGDGAVAEGEFHECMNLAALWRLPVLFCCENNRYAMGTALERYESETDLALKAASDEMTSWSVDGMDVIAVEDASRRAVAEVRDGGRPAFLELRTYRFRAHSMYDPDLYRAKEEIERYKQHDPIPALIERLESAGLLGVHDIEELEQGVADEIEAAIAFAEAGTFEPVEDLERFIYWEGEAP